MTPPGATAPPASAIPTGVQVAAHADTGAAGLVTLLAVLVFSAGALAGLAAAADLSVTAARARAAADAAALAGMATSPLVAGGDAVVLGRDGARDAAAERVAQANGAALISSEDAAWPLRYGVTIEVAPVTQWVRRVVGPVRAKALAGVRPAGA